MLRPAHERDRDDEVGRARVEGRPPPWKRTPAAEQGFGHGGAGLGAELLERALLGVCRDTETAAGPLAVSNAAS